jgi:hypothetical protein
MFLLMCCAHKLLALPSLDTTFVFISLPLYGADLKVKLVDFEFSHLFTQPIEECDGNCGTYGYISPENWAAWYGKATWAVRKQVRVSSVAVVNHLTLSAAVCFANLCWNGHSDGSERSWRHVCAGRYPHRVPLRDLA